MKKFLSIMALAGAVLAFNSCKKGEEDPFLSFKSRDNRIQGEWLLDNVQITKETITLNRTPQGAESRVKSTRTYSFSKDDPGSVVDVTMLNGAETNNQTRPLISSDVTLTINADGTYSSKDSVEFNIRGEILNFKNKVTGQWIWGNSKKNKAAINFTSSSSNNDENSSDFSNPLILGDFNVVALKADQLKLEQNYSTNYFESSDLAGATEITVISNVVATFRK
ncbi:MAG: hypothetical protein KDC92_00495 [Bacteroidetes bacterium]|nr:hypothetical protein [Bacteroidota bacterium]